MHRVLRAEQAELSQEALGLVPKVVMQGEPAPDPFPEMVEVGAGEAGELQQRGIRAGIRRCSSRPGVWLSTPGTSVGRGCRTRGRGSRIDGRMKA